MSQKRKRLSLKEKFDIIFVCETEKLSVRDVEKKFGVGKTQVSQILKDKKYF